MELSALVTCTADDFDPVADSWCAGAILQRGKRYVALLFGLSYVAAIRYLSFAHFVSVSLIVGVSLRMKDTPVGRKGSFKYNNTVRLETLRCAMVEQLRSPPLGFEEVTIRHFAMCRQRIIVQARRWMLEARVTSLYARYERTYSELLLLLADESMNMYECLAPLAEDVKALESLEPSFLRLIPDDGSDENVEQADQVPLAEPAEFNPWAVSPFQVSLPAIASSNETGNDSGDELYE